MSGVGYVSVLQQGAAMTTPASYTAAWVTHYCTPRKNEQVRRVDLNLGNKIIFILYIE